MEPTPPRSSPRWDVILASASPARLRLLRAAGLDPRVMVSRIDEPKTVARLADRSPAASCLALANAKARQVAARAGEGSSVVIGADSILDVDGESFGKPDSTHTARKRLRSLNGRTAVLRTGHCVIRTTDMATASGVFATEVRFGNFTENELEWYLKTGESQAVAGGFTLDGLSAPFMDGIVGDHGNVIGLSLPGFRQLLAELGIAWPDLRFNHLP